MQASMPMCPIQMTSGAKADGCFNNDAFIYDAAKKEYIYPDAEALIWRYTNVEKGLTLHHYWSSKCRGCAMKPRCTSNRCARLLLRSDQTTNSTVQRGLETLRQAKKHFDRALGQCFQVDKSFICPQFCPHSHIMHGRSRLGGLTAFRCGH